MKRNLFTYWHQGFEFAPRIIDSCVRTFVHHNRGFNIHFLDSIRVKEWIDPIPIPESKWKQLRLAHQCDIIRTQLLIKYGGVWADPTVWFCKPLDEWLPQVMDAGVFMFHRPGRDRAISNWFIASEAGNPLLQRQYETLCRFWRENEFDNLDKPNSRTADLLARLLNRNLELPRLWLARPVIKLFRTAPYMVYHYMLHDLVRSEAALAEIWRQMPKLSADIPHALVHHGLFEPLDSELKGLIDSGVAPLFKLSWKRPSENVRPDSVLAYLAQTFQDSRRLTEPEGKQAGLEEGREA